MHTLTFPQLVSIDRSVDRSLRILLAALAMLAAVAFFVPTDWARPPESAVERPVTLQLAGGKLGAQVLEASPDDIPMICLACSTLL